MRKSLIFALIVLLLLPLTACSEKMALEIEKPSGAETILETAKPLETEPPELGYIWTISIDDTKSETYGDGQLTANYTVHLSASKEGGDSPIGDYRGEIRVDYQGVPDAATIFAIEFLEGSYDFEGWGDNDAFSFSMEPYDHTEMMGFVTAAYQGAGARLAPLIEGIAMHTAEDIPWTSSDWGMGLDAGLEGVFGIDAFGDDTGGASNVYTPFGGGSASSDEPVPLRCSIHFIDESRVQLNIWSHGNMDVNLSFNGTLDKVPLSDTIPAG